MAVALAPVRMLDTLHVADAKHGYFTSKTLTSYNGHVNGSLSPYNCDHFDFGTHSTHHELPCSKCSCLPIECQCVESHPVGPAYCPNPDQPDLPREFETHVQVVVRVPEMQEVEETRYRKVAHREKQKVSRPRSAWAYDEVEHFEMVPVVRNVTKTRTEIHYDVYTEEIEVTVIEQRLEYEEVCVTRKEPKVITEEVEEYVQVPVVKEVKVTKIYEEWTGKYIESEVEKFCSPGDFNLICEDTCHHSRTRKSRSSASSLSGGDSPSYSFSASKTKKTPNVKDLVKPKKSHSMTEDDLKAAATKATQARPIF